MVDDDRSSALSESSGTSLPPSPLPCLAGGELSSAASRHAGKVAESGSIHAPDVTGKPSRSSPSASDLPFFVSNISDAAVNPSRRERFVHTSASREALYERLQLSRANRDELEASIADAGKRKVGKGALRNTTAKLPERKCQGDTRQVESHSVELFYALALELDPSVTAYYAQVPFDSVTWRRPNGKKLRSNKTADFLVFHHDKIAIVECKDESDVLKERDKWGDWGLAEDRWIYAPFEAKAIALGISSEAFVQTPMFGIALQNLEAMMAVVDEEPARSQIRLMALARRQLKRRPATIASLVNTVAGFTARLALWMLANRRVFGLVRSRQLPQPEQFLLYVDQGEAEKADNAARLVNLRSVEQPRDVNAYLCASPSSRRVADRRAQVLEDIAHGRRVSSPYYDLLARRVNAALADNQEPLAALVGRFENSGNTRSRLGRVKDLVQTLVRDYWDTGIDKTRRDFHARVDEECTKVAWSSPSYKTSRLLIARYERTQKRALNTGGMRAFQAIRTRTDPSVCTLPPIGFLHTLIIDSSDFDMKVKPEVILGLLPEKPKFYVGIDGCSKGPVAHSLIFGAARRDGVAILLREYVRRHGRLPNVIQSDKGPENTSSLLKEFCRINWIILRYPPTASSRTNGDAENIIGLVNSSLAAKLSGSTANDRLGRKVDGRFKSAKHAVHAFELVSTELNEMLYETIATSPRGPEDLTPNQARDRAVDALGIMGRPQAFNHSFLIQTSIPIPLRKAFNAGKGFWFNYGWYTSATASDAAKFEQLSEVRSDCVDPSIIYGKFGSSWFSLFSRSVQQFSARAETHKLFALLNQRESKRAARETKRDAATQLRRRVNNAERAASATRHLHPSTVTSEKQPTAQIVLPRLPWAAAKVIGA